MASESLNTPVNITALGISAASLPAGLSVAYETYLLSQAQDFTSVAGKANEAGQGAYDAQIKNDEQDETLENHELRISSAESEIQNHEQRISQVEGIVQDHEQRIAANELELQQHEQRLEQAEQSIDSIQLDYVSKSETLLQAISSPINVSTSYSVNGKQVIGIRQEGFTPATGSALKGAFNADATFTVSTTYTQSEVAAMASALIATRQRVKALEDAMRTHGLID